MRNMSRCYDVPGKDPINEHMQSEKAGLSWNVHRRRPLARHEFSNLGRLICGMNPGQWRQPLLQARVHRAHMIQWVPTPNRPLPLGSAIVVVLLETHGHAAPSTPFHLETFSAASRHVFIVRAYTIVVLEASRTLFETVGGHKACTRANVSRFSPAEYTPSYNMNMMDVVRSSASTMCWMRDGSGIPH
jgi:hypothetical protein